MTAQIIQHPNMAMHNALIAQYYLGSDQSRTFRLRCYEFCESSDDTTVRMRLYRPLAATEKLMRSVKYELSHPSVLALPSFSLQFEGELRNLKAQELLLRDFEYLNGCDVIWNLKQLNIPFISRPLPGPFPRYYRGILAEGSCKVCSQQDPNVQLVAYDDLKLSVKQLDINDRVYTLDGKLLIGSVSGEPYKMVRII